LEQGRVIEGLDGGCECERLFGEQDFAAGFKEVCQFPACGVISRGDCDGFEESSFGFLKGGWV
jgi:hypothetical protein